MLAKALGNDKVYALYIDTGFMRKNETVEIKEFLSNAGVKNLHVYDASEEFFTALKGVVEPEEKRKVIGSTFLEVQKKYLHDLGLNPDHWLLGQGTIYPDTIESGGTKNADKIKTHHNRVPEIEEMIRAGKVIEPIKELYKDEVRAVGRRLGLPDKMVDRHPFPGPGLAVRCLCVDTVYRQDVDNDYSQKLKTTFHYNGKETFYEGHILPIKSVGVQGDERTYRQPLAIDLMTKHDWNELRVLAPAMTNANSSINRVMLTIATKDNQPISNIQITAPSTLTKARIEKLQEADKLVMDFIYEVDVKKEVWQCPTVLLPLSINAEKIISPEKKISPQAMESIVIRPVSSMEAMTANFTELPWDKVQELAQKILKIDGISAVFYDITNKPPGTIEWE